MKYNFTYNEDLKFGILEWFDDISFKEFAGIYKDVMKHQIKYIIIDIRNLRPDIYKTELCKKIFKKITKVGVLTNTINSIIYNFVFLNVEHVKCFTRLEDACKWMFVDNAIIGSSKKYKITRNTHFNYGEVTWFKSVKSTKDLLEPIKIITKDPYKPRYLLFEDLTKSKINKDLIRSALPKMAEILQEADIKYIAINSKDKIFSYYMNLMVGKTFVKFFCTKNKAILWLISKNKYNE